MVKALVLAWGLISFAVLCGEDTPTPPTQLSPEEQEAAAEDTEAAKVQGELASALTGIPVTGRYSIMPSEDKEPVIVGQLRTKEKTYLVKVDNADARKALSKCNGKEIVVFGKERNKGKYLIVSIVQDDGSGPAPRRKGKGF